MKILDELKRNSGVRTKFAILTFRIGFIEIYQSNSGLKKILCKILYKVLKLGTFILQCGELPPKDTYIDWGIILPHGFNSVIINHRARIGKNSVIYHNTTVGLLEFSEKYPIIGDNVYIGTGSLIIGDVSIGNNCKIGAGTKVINRSIPDNCTVINKIDYDIIANK